MISFNDPSHNQDTTESTLLYQVEDYHSQIIEKGTLLQKPEHEIIARFIDGFPEKAAFFVRAGQPPDLTVAFTSAKIAETCGYRQSDLPSIATSPKQQDSSENTNIHTLTQEVAKLSKTVSELVISKQSGQSNSLNQPSYSFSPQQNVQLTCYSCNFPGHKRKDCNYNDQFQPTPDKCQLCRHKGILRIDVKPNLTDDRETPKALATTGPIAKGTANISY
jgi:hypothetical protein